MDYRKGMEVKGGHGLYSNEGGIGGWEMWLTRINDVVLFSDMLAQILVERVLLDGEDSKAAVKKEQNEIEKRNL